MQRNGPQYGECGLFIRYRLGNFGAEVDRRAYHLGMFAVADDPFTFGEPGNTGAHPGDTAHIAVAQRQWLIQLVEDRFDGRLQTVGLDLVQHYAHFIRLPARLVDPARLAEFDQHAFGAGGNQGVRSPDQQLSTACFGHGNVGDFRGSGF